MEVQYLFHDSAVALAMIDFVDPALAGQPDVRERGVRLEVRPVRTEHEGSVYASSTQHVDPGLVRVDLLESAPHAADRMHWHPQMADGEPGDRTFDAAMAADPVAWLRGFLGDLAPYVGPRDAAAIADAAEGIAAEAARLLEAARAPWSQVTHDERGLAIG